MITLGQLARVAVVGTSCAGKTTLARKLAHHLNVLYIELDAVYWGPDWTPIAADQFRASVDSLTTRSSWVCDGNYAAVRDLVWERATAIVWLNYSFPIVFYRALQRTLRRCLWRTPVFAENCESFGRSFFSRDSILLWVLRTHWRRQREFRCLLGDPKHSHIRKLELQTSQDADEFLRHVSRVVALQPNQLN